MTPCIWLGTTRPCNPPNYGLWVKLFLFMLCIYKHCLPSLLPVSAMKCCTTMPCPLPHNHYCWLLSSPMCLPHLLICTCHISSPIACPPSSVLCWCLLRFFLYFWYVLPVCSILIFYPKTPASVIGLNWLASVGFWFIILLLISTWMLLRRKKKKN